MVLLLLFAVLAGAGTALSPCVLPVLPALLSAGVTGGRRRPLGIVIGLSVTFTVTIVGVAKVVDGVGLGTDPLRAVAVVVLLIFGLTLLLPALAARLEAPSRAWRALGPKTRGDGFASGLAVGAALGFVYTPCAGPILAAVISVSAATGKTVAVAIAYALGSALVLFALSLGGRRLLDRMGRAARGPTVQRVMGLVMVATALAIITSLDVSFDQFVAQNIPDVNLTASLEKSHAVRSRLTSITGRSRFAETASSSSSVAASAGLPGVQTPDLPVLGPAPDFVDNQRWFNTPGGRPLTLASLRGRVVLIDFWTYTCINCIRTLPYLKAWDAAYRKLGLSIIGVESPEFSFEKDAGNVASAISQFGIRYPVVQDNNLATWNAWGNQYWPAEYLIDAQGQVRRAPTSARASTTSPRPPSARCWRRPERAPWAPEREPRAPSPRPTRPPRRPIWARRGQWVFRGPPAPGQHRFPGPSHPLSLSQFAYHGTWTIAQESATAGPGAELDARFQAKNVYLVMGSPGRPRHLGVLLDGHPILASNAGADVHNGVVTVSGQRLCTRWSRSRAPRSICSPCARSRA